MTKKSSPVIELFVIEFFLFEAQPCEMLKLYHNVKNSNFSTSITFGVNANGNNERSYCSHSIQPEQRGAYLLRGTHGTVHMHTHDL